MNRPRPCSDVCIGSETVFLSPRGNGKHFLFFFFNSGQTQFRGCVSYSINVSQQVRRKFHYTVFSFRNFRTRWDDCCKYSAATVNFLLLHQQFSVRCERGRGESFIVKIRGFQNEKTVVLGLLAFPRISVSYHRYKALS